MGFSFSLMNNFPSIFVSSNGIDTAGPAGKQRAEAYRRLFPFDPALLINTISKHQYQMSR